ncbi:short-chain dehydrogenase [Trichoderma harzianum]|uniref:Short-chain dehydrogenase n=1 Tax=Trichoderma harzianum TaxID=5544 RepID=A0A0G0A7J9_TRIHA|nr:short-chain dehydrogenase [Trichoderma harzianum]
MPSYLVTGSSRGLGLGFVTELETSRLLPGGLDNLVSSAGVNPNPLTSFEDIEVKEFVDEVIFNLTTTLLLLREFVPLIRKSVSKKVLVISSVLGSTELGASMPNLQNAYSTAKAALNMMVRKWSAVLKDQGITTVLLHPGTEVGSGIEEWMKTYAPNVPRQTIEECAESSMKVLAGITPKDNGLFYNYDGTKVPW